MKNNEPIFRCPWAGTDPTYVLYHDTEWGVPISDDNNLFEFLILEGAQAGLSWITILKRRASYRAAFKNFVPERVARFGKKDVEKLLKDPGIIRNRLKIHSAVENAKAFLKVQEEFGSFLQYQWRFVGGQPMQNTWKTPKSLPAQTKESIALSQDLKKRKFSFVGPTIIYAHMQATGMVNDHLVDCFRHREIMALAQRDALGTVTK